MTSIKAFRWIAVAEATSWLLLIIATIVKYAAHEPNGVHAIGPVHGVLFIGYVLLALPVRRKIGWNAQTLLIVLAESIVPFGGFFAARRPELAEPAPSTI